MHPSNLSVGAERHLRIPFLGDASPNPLFAEGSIDLKRSFVATGEAKHQRNTTFLYWFYWKQCRFALSLHLRITAS